MIGQLQSRAGAPMGGGPVGYENPMVSALGTRAMQALRARLSTGRNSANFMPNLDAMFRQYGIDARTGQGLFGGLQFAKPGQPTRGGTFDIKGYDAVSRAIAAQTWTSQDFETRQKEFKYGGLIMESRIADAQRELETFKKGIETNDPNYSLYLSDPDKAKAFIADREGKLAELNSKKEAAYGFSGLMDLAGQVYEGKSGSFTDLMKGLDKGIYLKQSIGGTWLSQAAATQQALGQAAVSTKMKADLVPLMGEADAAAREGGYDFNLAAFTPEVRQSWEKYFDARLAAKDKNEPFDENKWALENPDDALKTVIQPPVASQANAEAFTRWGVPKGANTRQEFTTSKMKLIGATPWDTTKEAPENEAMRQKQMSTETMFINSLDVARIGPTGKPVLKGIEGGQLTDERRTQQDFLNRPDVTYSYEYKDGTRVLKAQRTFQNAALGPDNPFSAGPELMNNENYKKGLVSMVIGARETKSQLWGTRVGGAGPWTGWGFLRSSTENMQRAQGFATNAVERHKYDAQMIAQNQAREDLKKARKAGFDPNKESLEEFQQKQWQAQQTVTRR